jgi:hypothetical protein
MRRILPRAHERTPPVWRGAFTGFGYTAVMATTRRRRIVRRAATALTGVVLLLAIVAAWIATREPPEIERSRALRIGMTESEVAAVMGADQVSWSQTINGRLRFTLCYGQWQEKEQDVYNRLLTWRGRPEWTAPIEDWPVQVRFDMGTSENRVDRIVRGDEVEE